MSDVLRLSLSELGEKLGKKEISSRELVQTSLDEIEKRGDLNSVIRIRPEQALKEAEECDARLGRGEGGALEGIPFLIKDNLALEGNEVTACSKILKGFKPPYTATSVKKLLEAGAVVVGQTNHDEFAMGSSTEFGCYGPAKNPWDTERVAGGSSGGSAAAVAAGLTPFALGSDTGGSIRQPASFCGVFGLRPTYGRVSRYGLFAYGSSLDQVGPLSRRAEDSGKVLGIMEGKDSRDMSSVVLDEPFAMPDRDLKGLKIGVPAEFMDCSKGLDSGVKTILESTLKKLEGDGAEIVEVHLPILDYIIPTYYTIAISEASSNLARYDGVHYGHRTENPRDLIESYLSSRAEGFGEEVQTRVMLGTFALSAGYYDAYYKKADAIRRDMLQSMKEIFSRVDLIAGPTSPGVAVKFGELLGDPMKLYMQDIYTTFVNLVYSPGVSVPVGIHEGMPVGMQLVGPMHSDGLLVKTAGMIENVSGFEYLN